MNQSSTFNELQSSSEDGLKINELMFMLRHNEKMKYLVQQTNDKIDVKKYYEVVQNSTIANITVQSFADYKIMFGYIVDELSQHLTQSEVNNLIKYRSILDAIILDIFDQLT